MLQNTKHSLANHLAPAAYSQPSRQLAMVSCIAALSLAMQELPWPLAGK
jgi:hypothetical protein